MKSALYIVKPGIGSEIVAEGYANALKHLNCRVLISKPSTKLQVAEFIEDHNIDFIFTSCKYGIRQLPVDLINKRNIRVAVEALPWNGTGLNLSGKYEVSDPMDIETIRSLKCCFVHTNIVEELWPMYMGLWLYNGIKLHHIPYAGDMFKALSDDYVIKYAASFVGNLSHKQGRIDSFIVPIFDRIRFLKLPICVYGDGFWDKINVNNNGKLFDINQVRKVYAKSLVCLNFHTPQQIESQACINQRSFDIQLYGSIQLTDSPLAKRYFGENVVDPGTSTKFIELLEAITSQPHKRSKFVIDAVRNAVNNHTYLNRLSTIFSGLAMPNDLCLSENERLGNLHMWNIESRLDFAEKGKKYESHIRGLV